MIFSFNRMYYKIDKDGLLELCFLNLQGKLLYFNGGGFSFKSEQLNLNSYTEFRFNQELNNIFELKMNEEMEFILSINKDILMKIFFFPNDNYSNGVQQVFNMFQPKNTLYSELLDDFKNSKKISLSF